MYAKTCLAFVTVGTCIRIAKMRSGEGSWWLAFVLKESDMTTFTDKKLINEIKERIGSLDVRDDIEQRAYEFVLASLEAEPVAWTDNKELRDMEQIGLGYMSPVGACERFVDLRDVIPLYRVPPVYVPVMCKVTELPDAQDRDFPHPSGKFVRE